MKASQHAQLLLFEEKRETLITHITTFLCKIKKTKKQTTSFIFDDLLTWRCLITQKTFPHYMT